MDKTYTNVNGEAVHVHYRRNEWVPYGEEGHYVAQISLEALEELLTKLGFTDAV